MGYQQKGVTSQLKQIYETSMENKNEIVLYQPDELTKIEVRVADESVWLSQQQMADLFGVKQPAISKHLKNIFAEEELDKDSVYSILEYTASDGKIYSTQFYNLDAILSVGYRVNSRNATIFRRWATSVLKQHLLNGYSFNHQIQVLEDRVDRRLAAHSHIINQLIDTQEKQQQQINFFIRTSLPPVEGVFYNGQIFDAYVFIADLVKSAKKSIVLIDNYIDESVLSMLDKRTKGVTASIYTHAIDKALQLDINKHNAQYEPVEVKKSHCVHDRFLIIDDDVYHIGASLKDLGKKLFAFSKMTLDKDLILKQVE